MTLATETELGPYRIVSQIGAGTMGEVYLARDTRLDRKVAIKLLPSELTKDATRLRRFEQEARAASALNHPNIVTIHEIGESAEGRYIVMEHVEGSTLRALRDERPPIDQVIGWGKQIAEALSVAHGAGIVHRDIKPANIMVREDGYVKVLDFGLARLAPLSSDENETLHEATNPGMLVGTAAYMSPEQARGEKVSSPGDIFALGIVLYEMLTGRRPFQSNSVLGVLEEITTATPPAPSRLNEEVSGYLDALILSMLEKDERLRPDAVAVTEAFRNIGRAIDGEATIWQPVLATRRRIVGRNRERSELEAAFAQVRAGHGVLVGVAGEPGIGKTTLVEDVLVRISERERNCAIARGRCSERLAGTEGYLPWLEALSNLLREGENSLQGRTLEFGTVSLPDAMQQMAPTWFLQVAPMSTGSSSAARPMFERAASQERLKRELVEFLKEASQTDPLVLFFEDLHWADASTIDLLGYVSGRFQDSPLMIIVTYRPSELTLASHPFLQLKRELQMHGSCIEIALDFLNQGEVETYLSFEFPENDFPAQLSHLIYSKTEGNPLFMVDLVRYLRDRGAIAFNDGRWRLTGSIPDVERDLPASVRGMIERKIGQLGDEDRQLLRAASVAGNEFDSAVITRAISADAAHVEERLDILERSFGLVRCLGEKELPDHTLTLRYRFVHVLYQNALYSELRPTRRAALSASVAETLRGFYGKKLAPVASRLAILYEAARDWAQSAEYFRFAARNSLQNFAFQESMLLSRRGLALVEKMPRSAERAKAEMRLLSTLGLAQMMVKGYSASDVLQTHLKLATLCRQLGDKYQLFQAQFGLSIVHVVRAEYDESRAKAVECMQLARELNDSKLLVQAHWAQGLSAQYTGEFVTAVEHLEASIALYDPEKHDRDIKLYGRILNRGHLGRVLLFMGYADRGLRLINEGVAVAEEAHNPLGHCNALSIAAFAHVLHGNIEALERLAALMLSLSEEHDFPHYRAHAQCLSGYTLAKLGAGDRRIGIEMLRSGIAGHRSADTLQQLTYYYALLAEAFAAVGQFEEAMKALEEAEETSRSTKEHFWDAEYPAVEGSPARGTRRRKFQEGHRDRTPAIGKDI